ncbi:MAG: DUF1080 domain-containing protein [Planctomycetaceae bacterium]
MRHSNFFCPSAMVGMCFLAGLLAFGQSAVARPQYAAAMSAAYPELVAKHGVDGKLTCAVCHPTKNKKERNNYGAALEGVLPQKNEKDTEVILAALKKASSSESATESRTFGALIEAGELPGTSDVVKAPEWVTMFDGNSFDGWKKTENIDSWKIVDGTLQCSGERSHLFYVADDKPFKNFEFECEVMTTPGSNAGIYFHTQVQAEGWPKKGFECQVNVTHGDPKKSGSLYNIVNVSADDLKGVITDNEWYKTRIKVTGRHILIQINDKTTVDYTEPEGKGPDSDGFERLIKEGTFALQAHDPKSVVSFRNLKVRRLP